MKVIEEGFVIYAKYVWDEQPTFQYHSTKLDHSSEHGVHVTVGPCTIEFEAPDNFDPRPQAVAALEAKKQELRAELGKALMQIDKQISSLLAIENTVGEAS